MTSEARGWNEVSARLKRRHETFGLDLLVFLGDVASKSSPNAGFVK